MQSARAVTIGLVPVRRAGEFQDLVGLDGRRGLALSRSRGSRPSPIAQWANSVLCRFERDGPALGRADAPGAPARRERIVRWMISRGADA